MPKSDREIFYEEAWEKLESMGYHCPKHGLDPPIGAVFFGEHKYAIPKVLCEHCMLEIKFTKGGEPEVTPDAVVQTSPPKAG